MSWFDLRAARNPKLDVWMLLYLFFPSLFEFEDNSRLSQLTPLDWRGFKPPTRYRWYSTKSSMPSSAIWVSLSREPRWKRDRPVNHIGFSMVYLILLVAFVNHIGFSMVYLCLPYFA